VISKILSSLFNIFKTSYLNASSKSSAFGICPVIKLPSLLKQPSAAIIWRLCKALHNLHYDKQVVMTRNIDKVSGTNEKEQVNSVAVLNNDANPDAFVSIHIKNAIIKTYTIFPPSLVDTLIPLLFNSLL